MSCCSGSDAGSSENALPIACTLSEEDKAAWWDEAGEGVLSGIEEVRELDDGFAFRYSESTPVPQKLRTLADWMVKESECCPFYRFEVELEPGRGPLWLRLRGRSGVKEYTVRELKRWIPGGIEGVTAAAAPG